MGNAESQAAPQVTKAKARRKPAASGSAAARKSAAESPKGHVQNYSNRYSSPFNRTQYLSHSASGEVDNTSGGSGVTIFSCIDDSGGEQGGAMSCMSLPPGSSVSTLYDVEANAGRQIVWEYQRFQPGLGWGAANFEDPKDLPLSAANNVRFATLDHEYFGDSMAAVAPPVPAGWTVDLSWSIVIQRRIRKRGGRGGGDVDETGMSDRFGWHYGTHLKDSKWLNTHQVGCNLRRRAWNRLLMKKRDDNFDMVLDSEHEGVALGETPSASEE